MKIAEALVNAKDMETKISSLQQQIQQNSFFAEGEESAVDAKALFAEMQDLIGNLAKLKMQIANTNNVTRVTVPLGEFSVSNAIILRDSFKDRSAQFRTLLAFASARPKSYMKDQLRSIPAFTDVSVIEGPMNDSAKIYRQLDIAIQGANWTTDLIEK